MKELSIEEKAKAYDSIFERLKEMYNNNKTNVAAKLVYERYFPELKESDGEMMVKFIKNQLFNIKKTITDNYKLDTELTDAISWLEKQGERGTNGNKKEIPNSEHKPADKVEPKFHEGEWIITNKNHIWYVDETPETTSYLYRLINQYGKIEVAEFEVVDKKARLWTIQDAKDGDVLADRFGVILFRKIGNEKYADAVDYHCAVHKSGGFIIQKGVSYWGLSKEEELRPTTLEQRVRFFDMMGDAGYEWDAVKKELKKIAWSEEDERLLLKLQTYVDLECFDRECNGQDIIDWLKSLRPQNTWKPSDEQMGVIEAVINNRSFQRRHLDSLYEQLKKLKG